MNIQQLRYFDGICRFGSFSKAAQNLYISPQGLSMSILRMEEEFSTKLFNRSSNGVSLTEAGEFLRLRAQKILVEIDECERYFSNRQTSCRTVELGCVYGGLSEFAAQLVLEFEEEHPNTKIIVTEYPGIPCDKALENGDVELAFNVAPFDAKKFESFLVFSEKLCLVVRDDHPLAAEKSITPDNLSLLNHLPMVTVNENFKPPRMLLELCKSFHIMPDVKMRAGEVIGVHRLVSTNPKLAGLTTQTVYTALAIPHMVAIPLECKELSWDVHLVKKRGLPLMPTAQAFELHVRRNMGMSEVLESEVRRQRA